MDSYWEQNHLPNSVKYENEINGGPYPYCETGLNFSTNATFSEDDAEYHGRRGKTSRQDPLSHRIIEKRRRDRMNSCLADLSRLIPPQYQRKGRGRIEKTEIIEMAIRHIKSFQKQESVCRDTILADRYRRGYNDCLTEAAKFLVTINDEFDTICYKMIEHLKEHCGEVMKSDYCKSRECLEPMTNGGSASSPSPPSGYHQGAPLSHLRDMLTSDLEHSSNDTSDVKDLSFRHQQPQQAPVITSTGGPAAPMDTHPPPDSQAVAHQHSFHAPEAARHAEAAAEAAEHNNNSYKFKNYIQQRFSQDSHHLHDEVAVTNCSHSSEGSERDSGVHAGAKGLCAENSNSGDEHPAADLRATAQTAPKSTAARHPPMAVPIFALHSQGTFYVPLSVDYDALVPYLGHAELLEKNYAPHVPVHPVNIHILATPPVRPDAPPRHSFLLKPKLEGLINAW
ncbi:transcription factor cwo [Phlebotomus argentipes]|uniref:transcription factor cwo n=1 Tax=Phlebotomus argentipes TaxID=94469 RepID=UPI002893592E|nr:transcription factor cwo [Phlebotomus argentipes]XP_059611460.1 transcription factor cwo [Phlebotomus argentipes]